MPLKHKLGSRSHNFSVQNTEFKKVVQDRGNRGEESISEAEKEMVKR